MQNMKRLIYRGEDGRTLTIYALPAVARVLLRNDRWGTMENYEGTKYTKPEGMNI